ncbi:hypothetical protein SALBM217S_05440 [Streptomyces griseoloalbus]
MPVNRDRKTAAPVSRARAMLGGVETKSVSPVFVGRTAELATLVDAFARAGAGEPQALLIGGEAGVGKTRLVEEFAAAVRDRGGIVALGGCVEIGADGLPFAPFSTALRQLRRALPDQLTAAADGQEEELARLLPELAVAAAREARRDEQGMARLFELTARLLERVAAEHTVVLVLEDLHWADASTRHLLAYLFRTLRTGRLVVVATYRSDDIHRRHPLRPLLAELDRLRTVQRVELDRFSRAEVWRQIAGILDREPEADRVDDIFERSDGNAFFVEELAVAADEGCPTGLTDSLRDLLLVRVENLPERAQRVVRIVAEGDARTGCSPPSPAGEDDLIEALRAAAPRPHARRGRLPCIPAARRSGDLRRRTLPEASRGPGRPGRGEAAAVAHRLGLSPRPSGRPSRRTGLATRAIGVGHKWPGTRPGKGSDVQRLRGTVLPRAQAHPGRAEAPGADPGGRRRRRPGTRADRPRLGEGHRPPPVPGRRVGGRRHRRLGRRRRQGRREGP